MSTKINPNAIAEGSISIDKIENLSTRLENIESSTDDENIVHKTGAETISGAKTFTGGVNLLGSGDSNAVTLSTNTRINVNGTTKTVLGFGSGSFYINHGDYNLLLRGKATRPTYNGADVALASDVNAKYAKPSTGIPKTDLASTVQASLNKADTALQSYTEQYKGTVTGVKINGTTKNPSSGVVDLGYINKQLSTSTSSSMTLSPNIYYRNTNTNLSTLTISLGSVSNSNILNEYLVEFTTRSSGTTVTLPSSVKWVNGVAPTLENGKTYQISIVNNLGTCTKFG